MRKIALIVIMLLALGGQTAVAQTSVPVGQIIDGVKFVVDDLWPKLEQLLVKSTNEKAKPGVVALYRDLLDIRSARNSLIQDLTVRLKEMRNSEECTWTCDLMQADADRLGKLLFQMRSDYRQLAVALNQDAPNMDKLVENYETPNGTVAINLRTSNVGALAKQQIAGYRQSLIMNTENFDDVLSTYRKFVKSHYPNSLELLAK